MPEFYDYVLPILDQATPKKNLIHNLIPSIHYSEFKNWYLIDCKLEEIPRDKTGLFLDSYQMAIQTKSEIFIDSQSFKKMPIQERAKLLLHEIVMSYYMMKYISLDDLCKLSNTCDYTTQKYRDLADFKALESKPLNDVDHSKIRKITSWLWENSANGEITAEKFKAQFWNNDFDKRFDPFYDRSDTQEKISISELKELFKKYEVSGAWPKFCDVDPAKNSGKPDCELSIKILDNGILDFNLTRKSRSQLKYLFNLNKYHGNYFSLSDLNYSIEEGLRNGPYEAFAGFLKVWFGEISVLDISKKATYQKNGDYKKLIIEPSLTQNASVMPFKNFP